MVKKICVCTGPTCNIMGGEEIIEKLENLNHKNGNSYEVSRCGCLGHCQNTPNVIVDEVIIESVNPKNVEEEILDGKGKKAKTINEYNAEELTKDNFLNDI